MRRLRLVPVVVILLACASPASARPFEGWIINGTEAPVNSYPWQVALISGAGTPQSQFCGGTLITPTRVATAAHCVQDENNVVTSPASLDVFANQVDLRLAGERRDVAGIAVHPDAETDTPPRFDAAVLTLASPITAAHPLDVIAPAGTAGADALWAPGDPLTVTGWGRISAPGPPAIGTFPNVLQEVELTRITDAGCGGAYGAAFESSNMVCAGVAANGNPNTPGGGRDSCAGDSGGGLLARTTADAFRWTSAAWRLVGMVSFGPANCDTPGAPGVYTRAAAPAIRSFLDNTTPAAPAPAGAPAFTGSPQPGQTVHCASPGWTGGPLLSERFEIYRLAAGRKPERVEADTQDHAVTSLDEGSRLVCLVSARTAGGQSVAESAALTVSGPAAPPAPAPPPDTRVVTPEPIRPAAPVDTAPPRASVVGRRTCRARRCTVTILVSDVAPSSGIAAVRARLSYRRPATCRRGGRRVRCLRATSRTVRARLVSGRTYRLRTPRLPKGRLTMRVTATDLAGNAQRLASIVRLVIR